MDISEAPNQIPDSDSDSNTGYSNTNFRAPVDDFISFCTANRAKCLMLLGVNLLLFLSIGTQNVPFKDDFNKILNGAGWIGDSRLGSQVVGSILNGNNFRFIDLGLTTFIVAAVVITLASLLAIYVLVGNRANWVSFLAAITFGLHPWAIGILAYRLETHVVAFSFLLSVLPLLWIRYNPRVLFPVAVVGAFLLMNFYQQTFGIAVTVLLGKCLIDFLSGNVTLKIIVRRFLVVCAGYILGIALYFGQLIFVPRIIGMETIVPRDLTIIPLIFSNIRLLYNWVLSDSPSSWLIAAALVLIAFIYWALKSSALRPGTTLVAVALFLILAVFASGSLQIISAHPWTYAVPRFRMGPASILAVLAILASTLITNRRWETRLGRWAVLPWVYYVASFVFIFSYVSYTQYSAFKSQSSALVARVLPIMNDDDTLYIGPNALFDAPEWVQARANIPLIDGLIPNFSTNGLFGGRESGFTALTGLRFDMLSNCEGCDLPPAPEFDIEAYRRRYPDLDSALGYDDDALIYHWENHGIFEGRRGFPTQMFQEVFRCREDAVCVTGTPRQLFLPWPPN